MNWAQSQFSLAGKHALITGANRGIGQAIAKGFTAAGATVWLHARNESEGRIAADALGGRLVVGDLSVRADIEQLIAAVRAQTGRLEVLVNNAGVELPGPFVASRMDIADRTMQVNAFAPMQLIQGLVPLLEAAHGASVINITSIHDTVPFPGNAAYAMSKAALGMLTKVLALELAPRKIRVNNLAPGAIETDINRRAIDTIGREKFASWIPAGRIGLVEEMVGPAIFLAADASSYCTGTTLYADGAYMQHIVRYGMD